MFDRWFESVTEVVAAAAAAAAVIYLGYEINRRQISCAAQWTVAVRASSHSSRSLRRQKATLAASFDQLVGDNEQRLWDG